MMATVYGVAVPQGSIRAFTPRGWKRPILTSDAARLKPWRQAIVDAARQSLDGTAPLEGPVAVVVVFYLPRPKSALRRIVEPAKKPDLDKLVRACCDALTAAGVWRDDAQVVRVEARKAFAGGGRDPEGAKGVPRAQIDVRPEGEAERKLRETEAESRLQRAAGLERKLRDAEARVRDAEARLREAEESVNVTMRVNVTLGGRVQSLEAEVASCHRELADAFAATQQAEATLAEVVKALEAKLRKAEAENVRREHENKDQAIRLREADALLAKMVAWTVIAALAAATKDDAAESR